MANFEATTASNDAKIKEGKEAEVKALLEKYNTTSEVEVRIEGGTICIYGYDWMQFYRPEDTLDYVDATEDFLTELAPLLESPLLIHCVGATKCRFPLSAMEVLVQPPRKGFPDGLVEWGGFEFQEDGSQKN